MNNIKINGNTPLEVEQAIVIGLDTHNNVKVASVGDITVDVILDLLNTVMVDALEQLTQSTMEVKPDVDETQLRNQLYEQAVMGFSLAIDKYHPEYKHDTKWAGLTNAAILKSQNEILKEKAKKVHNKKDKKPVS